MGVYLIAGDFGTGKTTFLKSYIEPAAKAKKEILVYCLMSKDFGTYPTIRNKKQYVDTAVTKANCLFLVDEAKTFFPGDDPDPEKPHGYKMIKWLLNARKANNPIFIVYHTLRELPLWLVGYADYLIRFRTNDLLQYQCNRFQSFPPIVKSLTESPTLPNFEYDEIKIRP